jgi:hypothetical protein
VVLGSRLAGHNHTASSSFGIKVLDTVND